MDDKKKIYRKTYYSKNKEKLIDYGKFYYSNKKNPTVVVSIIKGEFRLYFD
jgi:hypothetical protein